MLNQEIKMQRKTVFYLTDVEKRLSVMERKLEFIEQADQIRNGFKILNSEGEYAVYRRFRLKSVF